MPDSPSIIYERRGRVGWVTINRPEVRNALDIRAHEQLSAAWDRFEADDEAWVAVLTGAGSQAFCAGQDLKELARRTAAGVPPSSFGSYQLPGWPRLTERLGLSKPLIARVNGAAYGGGCELALACDIIVAADTASFALPEAKLGLVAGAGGTFRLPRQVPVKVAVGHLLTGRPFDAARAYELGLVNEVVPAADLDSCVAGWVADLLRCSPLALQATKEAVYRSLDLPLEQAFRTRYRGEERRLASRDPVEGPAAFLARRDPRWQGLG